MDQVNKVADGWVMLPAKAQAAGLIDGIGSFDSAMERLQSKARKSCAPRLNAGSGSARSFRAAFIDSRQTAQERTISAEPLITQRAATGHAASNPIPSANCLSRRTHRQRKRSFGSC